MRLNCLPRKTATVMVALAVVLSIAAVPAAGSISLPGGAPTPGSLTEALIGLL